MKVKRPPAPPGGPPKKGFWGALASLIPKRPAILKPQAPTAPTKPAVNDGSKSNPASTDSTEGSDSKDS